MGRDGNKAADWVYGALAPFCARSLSSAAPFAWVFCEIVNDDLGALNRGARVASVASNLLDGGGVAFLVCEA